MRSDLGLLLCEIMSSLVELDQIASEMVRMALDLDKEFRLFEMEQSVRGIDVTGVIIDQKQQQLSFQENQQLTEINRAIKRWKKAVPGSEEQKKALVEWDKLAFDLVGKATTVREVLQGWEVSPYKGIAEEKALSILRDMS